MDAWEFDRGNSLVSIGAWVLMPNHFHLYLTPSPKSHLGLGCEKLISKFMQKVLTSYSKYFNKRHERAGGLFEGVFQSVHVTSDEQAKYLFSYIHLNPIKLIDKDWKEKGIQNKQEAFDFLKKYPWSSYHDHRGSIRPESKVLSMKDFPEYFSSIGDFDKEILEWLSFKEL